MIECSRDFDKPLTYLALKNYSEKYYCWCWSIDPADICPWRGLPVHSLQSGGREAGGHLTDRFSSPPPTGNIFSLFKNIYSGASANKYTNILPLLSVYIQKERTEKDSEK